MTGFVQLALRELNGTAHQNSLMAFACTTWKQVQNVLGYFQHPQFSATLSFFMARTLTVFDAGLALKTQGSLVKGLMPFFAAVAGFFFNFMLSMPANLKFPCFLI